MWKPANHKCLFYQIFNQNISEWIKAETFFCYYIYTWGGDRFPWNIENI